jgi:hypothetical protein
VSFFPRSFCACQHGFWKEKGLPICERKISARPRRACRHSTILRTQFSIELVNQINGINFAAVQAVRKSLRVRISPLKEPTISSRAGTV